jgi:hypothetical protein
MVKTFLSDAALSTAIIVAMPLAIVLLGAPIVLLMLLLVELVQRLS